MKYPAKPSAKYHIAVCDLASKGWRKLLDVTAEERPGSYMRLGTDVCFISWNGEVVPMSMVTPEMLKSLREQLENRPFGTRAENPETILLLIGEIERLNREVDRLRRSLE